MVITVMIDLSRAHKNVARAVHFEPLLDQNLLIAGGDAMPNHPGCAASSGGTGSGIVSVVKNHAGVKPGFRIDSFPANKIKEFSAAAREIFRSAVDVEAKILECL